MTHNGVSYDFDMLASETRSIRRPVHFTKTTPRSALSRVVLELRCILSERAEAGGLTGMDPAACADQVDGGRAPRGDVPGVFFDLELLRIVDEFILEVYQTYMDDEPQYSHAHWLAWGYSRRPIKPYKTKQLAAMFDVKPNVLDARLAEIDEVMEQCMARRQWKLG